MANAKDYEAEHNKRLIKLIIGVLVSVGVVLAALFWMTSGNDDSENEINSSVSLLDEEKMAAESVAREFVKSSGNFGIRTDQITGNNIRNVSHLIHEEDTSVKDYLLTREDSYNFVKSEYVYPGSPLDYDSRAMAQWKNQFESNRLATFEAKDVVAESNKDGKYLSIEGRQYKALNVKVSFNSKETIRDVTANDTSWDGSYNVLEKTFPNNTVNLLMVESDEGWKTYQQSDLENQFLLSSWKTPNSDNYAGVQNGFILVDTLTLTEPLKEPVSD